jgi:hypothetical protein
LEYSESDGEKTLGWMLGDKLWGWDHVQVLPPQCFTLFLSLALTFWSIELISQFLDYLETVELLGRVISSSQGLYLNTGQHKHRKTHTHIKHPCPEWDSNPRSQLSSEQRQYMSQTARLQWSAPQC